MTNLAGIVRAQAAQAGQGERQALRQGGRGLTYAELERGSGAGRGPAARAQACGPATGSRS